MRNIPGLKLLKKGLPLLLHPLLISLVVTTIIFQLFPVNIPKYQIIMNESIRQEDQTIRVWDDLENDSVSDQILIGNYDVGYAYITVYFHPSGKIKEWDIPGKLVDLQGNFLFFQPPGSTTKEMVVFTQSHDSLYLNRISDMSDQKPVWKQIFIATFKIVTHRCDAMIVSPQFTDLDGDGRKVLLFGISAGFSLTPRSLFIYDFQKDTIFRSIETGSFMEDFLVSDINGDRRKEIVTMTYAPQNILGPGIKYHDSSNWTMVFDHTLKLMFPPSEFEGRTGNTRAFGIPTNNLSQKLYILWSSPEKNPHGIQIYLITSTGQKKWLREFSEFDKSQARARPFLKKIKKDYKLVFPLTNGNIYFFDSSFRKYDMISLNHQLSYLKPMDIDLDGNTEFLAFDLVSNILTIYREDFSHPVSLKVEFDQINRSTFSMKMVNHSPPELGMMTGRLYYLLSYQKNHYWYARWGIWAATWLCIFLFILLIRRIQFDQIQKQLKTEKKITELQLKIVRNQMDPHFTMNAINSVIEAVNRNEKEEATKNLIHFSKMYRSLVLSADQITRTLGEELDFTRNYLELEKFRFRHSFDYSIDIPPEVSLDWPVPKMIIQSPVENAIKHGLLNLDGHGYVKIKARKNNSHLILEIIDNGIGRKNSAVSEKKSTGKGMMIMEEFLHLYSKITGKKAETRIEDIEDNPDIQSGTMVIVRIEL